MDLDKLENAININDYNFTDCLGEKIQLYDIILQYKGKKYLIYLIINFLNERECKTIELNNLNSYTTSKITLAGYSKKFLIVTNHFLTHPIYGPKFHDIISMCKQGTLSKKIKKKIQ